MKYMAASRREGHYCIESVRECANMQWTSPVGKYKSNQVCLFACEDSVQWLILTDSPNGDEEGTRLGMHMEAFPNMMTVETSSTLNMDWIIQ